LDFLRTNIGILQRIGAADPIFLRFDPKDMRIYGSDGCRLIPEHRFGLGDGNIEVDVRMFVVQLLYAVTNGIDVVHTGPHTKYSAAPFLSLRCLRI
jgi:hypothetical protein